MTILMSASGLVLCGTCIANSYYPYFYYILFLILVRVCS